MSDPKTVRRSETVEVDGEKFEVRQFGALKFYRLLDRYGAYQNDKIGLADLYVPTVADALDRTDAEPPGPPVRIMDVARMDRKKVAAIYAAVLRVNDFQGYIMELEEERKKKTQGLEEDRPPTS